MTLRLEVPGNPVGKQRARVTRQGHAYTPKKTAHYESYVKALFVRAYPGHALLDGPLEMEIEIGFPIPASASKKARAAMLAGAEHPTKKPDASNVQKILEDALNTVAYRDDSQIVAWSGVKRYHENPRTILKVRRVGEEP